MGLDPVLLALAGCPVIQQDEPGGHIVQNPYPVISASDDLVLAHEICHKLAGRVDGYKFATACHVRNNPVFAYILNLVVDWFDETNQASYSMYLEKRIQDLHERDKNIKPPKGLEHLWKLYFDGVKPKGFPKGVDCIEDLIVYADLATEEYLALHMKKGIAFMGAKKLPTLSAGSDLVPHPNNRNNFYLQTVSKYNHIIETVSSLWTRNKYKLESSYFGEINWRNLTGLVLGDQLGLPVYNLFRKRDIARDVYLVVDKSGSTSMIKNPIMETAIIITESFRRVGVKVSILDVGHKDTIINKIDEPLKLDWFEPLASGGTPLGKVCSMIETTNPEDYLFIITDGQPDNWEVLNQALAKFKGYHLTFVVGDAFRDYYTRTGGHAVSVEPTTIVRELINDSTVAA